MAKDGKERDGPEAAGAPDIAPAGWVVAALRGFGESVRSLVPEVFPAYARILHPAYRRGQRVRWAEIAQANGRPTGPMMRLSSLTCSDEYEVTSQPGVFDEAPWIGALPPDTAEPLVAVLARHTTTADRCWLALWEGWSGLPESVRSWPTFQTPEHRYHLGLGPIEILCTWPQPPNLCWPQDRAWFVGTGVNHNSTYVGASRACVEELLADPALEAHPAAPTDRVGRRSGGSDSHWGRGGRLRATPHLGTS